VDGQSQLLELTREALLARADQGHQLLRGLLLHLKAELAAPLEDPLGQLPWLRRGVLAHFAAGLLDRLRELLERLATRDRHQDGLRRHLGKDRLQGP
jgi:hypothetical protein